MPLQQTSGNVTADAFGGGVAAVPNYIEDVFSTYLYTGNSSTQTITNGIDLSTKGGLVWIKERSPTANAHILTDTARGVNSQLVSNSTSSAYSFTDVLTAFNANGFNLGNDGSISDVNTTGHSYASWTFRKQPKFFDVVTYTGTGSARTIAHALGSAPGCIIVKRTDTTGNWQMYHNGLASAAFGIQLNLTAAQASDTTLWNSTAPTTSVFSLKTNADVNASGGTYVAYLFAHNAGGFGLTGTDNVVSCGNFTFANNGTAGTDVALGYEPQWVLIKQTSGTSQWNLYDTMRGMPVTPSNASNGTVLYPNLSDAEVTSESTVFPTATGFNAAAGSLNQGDTYIYIAIRRGPMKVPTDATKVFAPTYVAGTGSPHAVTGGSFPPDLFLSVGNSNPRGWFDRLRGNYQLLQSNATAAEFASSGSVQSFNMNGVTVGADTVDFTVNNSGNYSQYYFGRAPGFFDEVCYTGTGAGSGSFALNHNLSAAPELIILRQRNGTSSWQTGTNFTSTNWRSMFLNLTNAGASQTSYASNDWFAAQPTAATFTVGWPYYTTGSYVAYLFATCPGVSKVGSYTGNGTTQTINCGFTGGARFVLIKRTDATGGWYVYDTARGMTTLTDPYFFLNNTNNQQATLGSVTTVTTGFALNSAITAAINVSGGTYIFLAIA